MPAFKKGLTLCCGPKIHPVVLLGSSYPLAPLFPCLTYIAGRCMRTVDVFARPTSLHGFRRGSWSGPASVQPTIAMVPLWPSSRLGLTVQRLLFVEGPLLDASSSICLIIYLSLARG